MNELDKYTSDMIKKNLRKTWIYCKIDACGDPAPSAKTERRLICTTNYFGASVLSRKYNKDFFFTY